MIILEKTHNILEEAREYLPREYKAELIEKVTYEESLCARFLVSKLIEKEFGIKKYLPKTDENGTPIWEDNMYWSISHKRGHILIGVDTKPIGVDLEVYKERDKSVFSYMDEEEWKILGEKNWNNFYIGWTAKEAALKSDLKVLDDISKYKITKYNNINNTNSSYMNEIQISCQDKKYNMLCGVQNNLYYCRTI